VAKEKAEQEAEQEAKEEARKREALVQKAALAGFDTVEPYLRDRWEKEEKRLAILRESYGESKKRPRQNRAEDELQYREVRKQTWMMWTCKPPHAFPSSLLNLTHRPQPRKKTVRAMNTNNAKLKRRADAVADDDMVKAENYLFTDNLPDNLRDAFRVAMELVIHRSLRLGLTLMRRARTGTGRITSITCTIDAKGFKKVLAELTAGVPFGYEFLIQGYHEDFTYIRSVGDLSRALDSIEGMSDEDKAKLRNQNGNRKKSQRRR